LRIDLADKWPIGQLAVTPFSGVSHVEIHASHLNICGEKGEMLKLQPRILM